ncbi:hypothetical protein [uncultured Dysosmobacter sp.]|uniref:hypothetical protein n=1 Tax=uncultured Dysosmobacter sp. TaxID=2591384 RepID=UPI00261DD803|nr:hypothetical protein [uncultured Dysosmobacter sp.]
MGSIKERVAALDAYMKGLQPQLTTFLLADGTEFHTPIDPFTYLKDYGAYAPDGRRIVAYPHPTEHTDGLSLSLYQMIDSAIEAGRLDLPDLESDEVGR